jgi:arylsulfatase A-like enzyme
MPAARVVLVSLDAVNPGALSPDLTPRLWALATSGGWAPEGGMCDLPSSTYVSHATLLTGATPERHGVRSNHAGGLGEGVVPGWAGRERVGVATLFDACREANIPAAAVAGDWHILRVARSRAGEVPRRWPAADGPDHGIALDAFGYIANSGVREPALAAAAEPDLRFLFVHLNETDTAGHLHGPASDEYAAACREADAIVGGLLDAVRHRWDDVVVLVVSDHGMELMAEDGAIDLAALQAREDLVAGVVEEGGSALVLLQEDVDPVVAGAALLAVPGVAGWRESSPGVLLVEAEPGRIFASGPGKHLPGIHGGAGTDRTVAIAGGGHPAVARIASRIAAGPPHLRDWAPTIAGVLGIRLPDAEGRDLSRELTPPDDGLTH